jgi:hypothetical protein
VTLDVEIETSLFSIIFRIMRKIIQENLKSSLFVKPIDKIAEIADYSVTLEVCLRKTHIYRDSFIVRAQEKDEQT